ncbi:MAG: hypothetical protein ACI8SR_000818 [Oceanicoccus sp.]|jgi:hypothetical protein
MPDHIEMTHIKEKHDKCKPVFVWVRKRLQIIYHVHTDLPTSPFFENEHVTEKRGCFS